MQNDKLENRNHTPFYSSKMFISPEKIKTSGFYDLRIMNSGVSTKIAILISIMTT